MLLSMHYNEDSRSRGQNLVVDRVAVSIPHSEDELISRHHVVAIKTREYRVTAKLASEAPTNCATS